MGSVGSRGGVVAAVVLAAWLAPAERAQGRIRLTNPTPAVWKTDASGGRFRVSFDPGHRLLLGAVVDQRAAPGLEVGLLIRSEAPAPGWDVNWAVDQQLLPLRILAPRAGEGVTVDGALYRGLFLRQSQHGTLTFPTSPPVALSLPFDIGIRVEVGRARGAAWPATGGAPTEFGLVHGEVLADFWRAHQPGRWLAVGLGARHNLGLVRDAAGGLVQDHRIAPLTELSVAVHGQRTDGLLAGGARLEGAYRWSSRRGWERAFRAAAEVEAIPLALNDRPLSIFVSASAAEISDTAPGTGIDLRFLLGLRLSQPLR